MRIKAKSPTIFPRVAKLKKISCIPKQMQKKAEIWLKMHENIFGQICDYGCFG